MVRVNGRHGACEPRTLSEARAVSMPCPAHDAPAAEWSAYHKARAKMFVEVAKSDPRHKHEALAEAWLAREKADEFRARAAQSP